MRAVKDRSKLAREVVGSPPLEIFKTHMKESEELYLNKTQELGIITHDRGLVCVLSAE